MSTTSQAKKVTTLQTALTKVHAWMTNNQLFSLEGFKHLLRHSEEDRLSKNLNAVHLSYSVFENCIRTEVPSLNKTEVELLCNHIDKQKSGHITSRLWQASVSDDHLFLANLLAPFLEVITHYGYNQPQTM